MTTSLRESHARVFCQQTRLLGEILWDLLRAEQAVLDKCQIATKNGPFTQTELTRFGHEVGRDAIHWWVYHREDDLSALHARSTSALAAADRLKAASVTLRDFRTESYDDLLSALRTFAERHESAILEIQGYLAWLRSRDPLAPAILFTYRVWGSTKRGDRWLSVKADSFQSETQDMQDTLTEIALGLRAGGVQLYAFDRAHYEVGADIYESNPDRNDEIHVPIAEVVKRTTRRTLDELAVFIEEIRNSLRNVLLDIDKCTTQRRLMRSEGFWREFIQTAMKAGRHETDRWDFKETLTIWHTRGDARNSAKATFAEDVASFANTSGGALIIGVTDRREIVGIGTGHEAESRLKFASDVLAERLDYPRTIVSFHQVMMPRDSGSEAMCLVILVADAMEPVGVNDGQGQFSYPVRRETGIARESPSRLESAKIHRKSDSYDYMDDLQQFVRDNHSVR